MFFQHPHKWLNVVNHEIAVQGVLSEPQRSRGRRPHIAVVLLSQSCREWLESRDPAPPETLLRRMIEEMAKTGRLNSSVNANSLADAGHSILCTLDKKGCDTRDAALDLLAVDALFTYAFELAADSSAEVARVSQHVLQQVISR